MAFFSGFRRQKTFSESSEVSNDGDHDHDHDHDHHAMTRGFDSSGRAVSLSTSAPPDDYMGQYHKDYDVDGKFVYSQYARRPQLYDLDGKHKYKYFNQLRKLKLSTETGVSDSAKDHNASASLVPQNESVLVGGLSIGGKKSPIQVIPRTPPVAVNDNNSSCGGDNNVLYDLDGKFSYTVYDPSQAFGSYKGK